MDELTKKALKRLKNHYPLIGAWFRRKGAEALIGTEAPEAVVPLLMLCIDQNHDVREAADKALKTLKKDARDHLCSLWAEKRDEELKGIIIGCGYLAARPALLTAITTFVQGKKLKIKLSAEDFHTCLLDQDEAVVYGAVDYLSDMKGKDAYPTIWSYVKEHPASIGLKVLHRKEWFPEEPSERALFYFLAGELALYHDIDFEQSHLRYYYETGASPLRETIASRIRKSGDTRLLAVFRTARGSRKKMLREGEVDLQIEILAKKKDYGELFHLLPHATYEQGGRIITTIQQAGWKHPDSHSRALQERLEEFIREKEEKKKLPVSYAMALNRDFRTMFLGSETPPQDDAGLSSWLQDNNNFRRRSAAVIKLAEKGSPHLADAVNRACADSYWQVRMAAAAAELMRPGTLSPANRALLENDHVFWVQAMLKLPREGRLTELVPIGLEELRRAGERPDPARVPKDADNFFDLIKRFIPLAEKEFLLMLGEFLGTEITVSEAAAYEAGAMDVEIEVEE